MPLLPASTSTDHCRRPPLHHNTNHHPKKNHHRCETRPTITAVSRTSLETRLSPSARRSSSSTAPDMSGYPGYNSGRYGGQPPQQPQYQGNYYPCDPLSMPIPASITAGLIVVMTLGMFHLPNRLPSPSAPANMRSSVSVVLSSRPTPAATLPNRPTISNSPATATSSLPRNNNTATNRYASPRSRPRLRQHPPPPILFSFALPKKAFPRVISPSHPATACQTSPNLKLTLPPQQPPQQHQGHYRPQQPQPNYQTRPSGTFPPIIRTPNGACTRSQMLQ